MAKVKTMNDRDIWLSAKALVDQHGDDAAIHAAMRADELLDEGDLDGAATWTARRPGGGLFRLSRSWKTRCRTVWCINLMRVVKLQ